MPCPLYGGPPSASVTVGTARGGTGKGRTLAKGGWCFCDTQGTGVRITFPRCYGPLRPCPDGGDRAEPLGTASGSGGVGWTSPFNAMGLTPTAPGLTLSGPGLKLSVVKTGILASNERL